MATKTPKYELQKKEDNDFYNIEDLNANWDKVENALTEFDDSGTAEGITSFTDMLAKLVTGNKLAVTLRNLKAGLQFVLHTGSIVNNCVTDNAKLPLSAAQGKVLQDAITKLNGALTNAKTTLSALNSKKHIVSTRDTTVNLSKSLIRGAYVDVKTTFTSVDGIIPIPVLKATGWFCGGVEIQNITATSMTVRFLNSNQTTQDGGYANYILLFIK